jgi:hypothetical protein
MVKIAVPPHPQLARTARGRVPMKRAVWLVSDDPPVYAVEEVVHVMVSVEFEGTLHFKV